MKTLFEIQNKLNTQRVLFPKDEIITDVTTDSRNVHAGSLFICLRGVHVDGHDFADRAAEAGATAIVTETPLALPASVTQFVVKDSRAAMQELVPFFMIIRHKACGLSALRERTAKQRSHI